MLHLYKRLVQEKTRYRSSTVVGQIVRGSFFVQVRGEELVMLKGDDVHDDIRKYDGMPL